MVEIPRMSFRRQLHRTVTAKLGTTVSLDSALEPSGTTPNVTALFPVRHARVTCLPNS